MEILRNISFEFEFDVIQILIEGEVNTRFIVASAQQTH